MKCIQAPWLRRGLYVEVMSMIYGHDGRCNPLLFMGFGSEQEGTGGDKRGKEREEKYGALPHTHNGYEHDEYGTYPGLSGKDEKLVNNVLQQWERKRKKLNL